MAATVVAQRALYLRWRPTNFSDVVGQDHVVRTLRNAITAGRPAHAYLLAGPRGTGKTSIARILYRAVNCLEPREGDPCGQCEPCRTALEGRALDLVEIDAASNRGIDDIRELREKVAFSPAEVRYRVYIIDEAHELTAPAWDAFLKTLEEPPPHVIFVLATTEAHRIPATIASRCQHFDLRRITADVIGARLLKIAAEEGLQLERAAAERIARMARGGLRDAISLLDQAASFTAGQVDLEALRLVLGLVDVETIRGLLEAVERRDPATVLTTLLGASDSGADLRLLADESAGQLRGLLYARSGAGRALTGEFSGEELTWFDEHAPRWERAELQRLLISITTGLVSIRDADQLRLHLELTLLEAAVARPAVDAGAEMKSDRTGSPTEAGSHERPTHDESAAKLADVWMPPPPLAEADTTTPEQRDPSLSTPVGPAEPCEESTPSSVTAVLAVDTAALSLEAVRARWPQVIDWVRERRPLIASYLQPGEPRDLTDGWLMLGFAFKLHSEQMAAPRNRDLVEQACQEVLGQSLRVRCELTPPTRAGGGIDLDDPLVKFALQRFGGQAEIVEE